MKKTFGLFLILLAMTAMAFAVPPGPGDYPIGYNYPNENFDPNTYHWWTEHHNGILPETGQPSLGGYLDAGSSMGSWWPDATSQLWTDIVGVANIPDAYTAKDADWGNYTGPFYNSYPSSWYVGDINGGYMISDGVAINLPGYVHFSVLKLPQSGGGSGYYYIDYAPSATGPWTQVGSQHQISHSTGTWVNYSTAVPAFIVDGVAVDPYIRIRFRSNTQHNLANNGLLRLDNVKANFWVDDFKFTEYPGDDPTPVELSSFTAVLTQEYFVNLTWVTQTETGVNGYYIFRSGSNNLADAQIVSPMIPATNTSQSQYYTFTDTNLYDSGTYYYWLQNVDYDGAESFHGPIAVYYDNSGNTPAPPAPLFTELKAVYPNPFNPTVFIPFSLANASDVDFRIYNQRGQIVKHFTLGNKAAGDHRISWDGTDYNGRALANGVYQIVMSTSTQTFTRKAVLVK